jgi:hypothetical protein
MATLNSSNITDGNTVEPNDLLQLYDAFTSGGGTTGAYNVTVSGSLIGNASTATTASFAVSSSRAITASFAVSSSRAITASFALNGGVSTQVNDQAYSNQGTEPITANFKFYAGTIKISGGAGTTSNLPQLAGKTLGTNVWVTATLEGDFATYGTGSIYVRSLNGSGAITFSTVNTPTNSIAHYHVIYIPG